MTVDSHKGNIMNLKEYQKRVEEFAVYPDSGKGSIQAVTYTALGLNGEAGEFAEVLKKVMRDSYGNIDSKAKQAFAKELGDVFWYLARCAAELGFDLENIASANIEKLTSRKERGVLKGNGDDR